jgi:hypothetical protein
VYCLQQCYFVYVVPFLCIKMGTNDRGVGEMPVPRLFDGTALTSFFLWKLPEARIIRYRQESWTPKLYCFFT